MRKVYTCTRTSLIDILLYFKRADRYLGQKMVWNYQKKGILYWVTNMQPFKCLNLADGRWGGV